MNGTVEAIPSGSRTKGSPGEEHVGRFRLLYRLGEGGMGAVFAACDTESPGKGIVALKTTKQQGVEAERILHDEAHIASRIEHANVCRVREFGKDGDTIYLVLDYCDGASLHDMLEAAPDRRLPLPTAVKIAAQVAAGLHAAHELRSDSGKALEVVHRDVSPQNILLSSAGHISVTDFGVAKALGQAHRATETGEVKGKASYMAPEQVRSRNVDRRADIFALGCVLYQATLGRRPFSGESTVSTLYQILESEIEAPTSIDASYPASLEKLLMRALEKDPNLRFSTAEEFELALETWLVEQGHLVTEVEIGIELDLLLGADLKAKKQRLLQLLSEPNARPLSASTIEKKPNDSTPPATAFDETQSRAAKRSDKRLFLVAGSVTLIATIAGFLYWGTPFSVEEPAQPAQVIESATSADHATPQAIAAPPSAELGQATKDPDTSPEHPPAVVTLGIQATPAAASIRVNGIVLGAGNIQHALPISDQPHEVKVNLPGYLAVTKSITVTKNTTLKIDLKRLPQTTSPPVRPPAPPLVPRQPTLKPKRSLDADNPFAQ